MIEPVSEDFTMLDQARVEGKGRDDDLRGVAQRGVEQAPDGRPEKPARASVASPIKPASGMIASADARNTRIGLAPNPFRPSPILVSWHRRWGSSRWRG